MVVIIGGMIRSGSTFSFNVVREALARSGAVTLASANSLDSSAFALARDEHFILKTHAPAAEILRRIDEGTLRCVCTLRRPEDAVRSWMNTFGFSLDDGISAVRDWLSWYAMVSHKVLTIKYSMIEFRPRLVIEQIIAFIGAGTDQAFVSYLESKYDKQRVKAQYDNLIPGKSTVDIGFSYYEKDSFFHRRHVSSTNEENSMRLTADQVSAVRNGLSEYSKLDVIWNAS